MRNKTQLWKRSLAALLSFAILLGMLPALGGSVAVKAEAALTDKNGVTIDEYITMPITIRDFAADGMLFEYNEVNRHNIGEGESATTYTKSDRFYVTSSSEAPYTATYNPTYWNLASTDGAYSESGNYTGIRIYPKGADIFKENDYTVTDGSSWYCFIVDTSGNILKVLDLKAAKTDIDTIMNTTDGAAYSVWTWRGSTNLPYYRVMEEVTDSNKSQYRFCFTPPSTDNTSVDVYLGRKYYSTVAIAKGGDEGANEGIYVYAGNAVEGYIGALSNCDYWHWLIVDSSNQVVDVIPSGTVKTDINTDYLTADYKIVMAWVTSTAAYNTIAHITDDNASEYQIVTVDCEVGSTLFVERTITVNEADTRAFGLLFTDDEDYIDWINEDNESTYLPNTAYVTNKITVTTDETTGETVVSDPLKSALWNEDGETYAYQDVYGAGIRTNLVTDRLDADNKPVYTEATVTFLAKYMQQIMAVPLYNENTTTYGDAGTYNSFHVMGTKLFDQNYGYVAPGTPDAVYDLADAIRHYIDISTATDKLGTYGASRKKFLGGETVDENGETVTVEPSLRAVHQIETWFDAAYFLLHNTWRDSSPREVYNQWANDGYGMPIPNYDRIHLIQTTNEAGEKCYVFNAKYHDSTYDYTSGQIFNSSFGSYNTENRPYAPAYTREGATYDVYGINLPADRFDPLGPSGSGLNLGYGMSGDTYGDFADHNAMNWAEYYNDTNYNLTLEGHAQFTYHAEANQYFIFTGDDDVYLYINGIRVLDIGAAHSIAKVGIHLNDVAVACGLEDGGSYRFDFFFMERHGTAANFGIETNIQIEDPSMSTTKVGYQNGENTGYNGYVIPDVPMVYEFGIENKSDIDIVDLTFADEKLNVSLTPSAIKLNTPKQKTDEEGNPLADENGQPVYEDETGTTIDELSVTIYNKAAADGTVTVKSTYAAGTLTETTLKNILTAGLGAGEKIVIHGFEHTILDTEWEYRKDSKGNRLSNDYYYNQVHTTAKNSLNRDKVLEGNDNWVVQKMPGSLTITKVLTADASSALQNATFTMQVLLEGKKIPAGTTYTVGQETRTVQIDGRIPLAAGETAVITGIPNGTKFEVQELPGTANGTAYWPSYEAVRATAGVNGVTGTIIENAVVGAIVTNHEDMLETDKWVTATEDANAFELTLESYALGKQYTVAMTKPADIVLVLDHSASMYTPAGAPGILNNQSLYNGDAIDRSDISITKGAHRGYYVAQSSETKSWFIMEYAANYALSDGTTAPRWVGYLVPNTESYVNPDNDSDTEHTKELSWAPGEVDTNLVFYKSQYAALYDSLLEFVDDLKNSGVEHNVAIVGFAGSEGDGTRLYVGAEGDNNSGYKRYRSALYHENTTQERRDELYQLAMKNVQNATEYQQLLSNIELIETNDSFTCPSVGLKLANEVFAANEVNLAERDRIVVLFTDGIPNKKIGGDQSTSETIEEIHNEIVSVAYSVKQQGATIYSISTTTLGTGDRTFLKYASSDYPNAVDYDHPGDAVGEELIYTRETSSELNLTDIFAEITVNTTTSSVELDETAILKEVLTDYFVLNPENVEAVSVYTQKAKADGTFEDLEPLASAKVTLRSSDGSNRIDTVEVTGFDYQNEYISSTAREVNGAAYYGSKLIVEVRIRTRDGFWGGNNVPTNESATAIYTPSGTGPNGETIPSQPVEYFPIPEVNVPINVEVTTKDKTIYYGGNIDTDGDGKEGDELITSVTIGGKNATIEEDGSIKPSESWMDDFADASWADGSTKPDSDLSNTEPKDYTYTVVVTPKHDGKDPINSNPGNLAGNIDGDDVEDQPSAETTKSAKSTGHIYVLVPELTFKDSVTDYGTPVEGYDYTGKDFVSDETKWAFMEDTADTSKAPAVSGEEPKLTLTYAPDSSVLEDGKLVTDTKVEVTVQMGETDITGLTKFHWEDCDAEMHSSDMNIAEHMGNESSNEFWIHVKLSIVPDIVVIDYGLDVLIDVLANDPKPAGATLELAGIAKNEAEDTFGTEPVTGNYGVLSIDNGMVRYSLNDAESEKNNGMQMNAEDTFRYQAKYTINDKETLLDSTVTVIPATSIYYEDDFLTYSVWNSGDFTPNEVADNQWKPDGTADNKEQAQDRPGDGLESLDADNIYGYDGAYTAMSTYSLDSAMKVTVDKDLFAEAQFTFYGTGFDVISLTNSASGTVMVTVYDADAFEKNTYNAEPECTKFVDTYYGYKYDENDGWSVDENASDTLYQVPVIKVSGLEYGRYTVVITVAYIKGMDHKPEEGGEKTSYDFWLDAIRIYDPANDGADNPVIEDAYKEDHEGWPEYFELRNLIISKNDFDSLADGEGKGIVFIDNTADENNNVTYSIEDYTNYGPNNELYLAPGQSVAFELSVIGNTVDRIHLAMKSVGGTASVEYYNTTDGSEKQNYQAMDIATATDLYYDITELNNGIVVIKNTSGSILSITNVKVTHSSEHTDRPEAEIFTISKKVAKLALMSLRPQAAAPVLAITQQPVDYVGMIGDNASFTVEAQGEGLTYQWYYRDGDAAWSKVTNGSEATLNVEFLAYRNNRQFRCEITDLNGSTVTTDIVTLSAQTVDLVITGQPVSATGAVNEELAFTVEAVGNGLTYQWFFSDDNGATWQKSGTPGYNTATLLPILRDYRNGYQYRCQISDVFGNVVTSDAATMTVKSGEISITAQPADVSSAALNVLYTFRVTATGENLTYRWEYSADGGATWQLSWNDGYGTDTLKVRMYATRNGYLYRCQVTSGLSNSVYTEPANLKLQAPSAEIVKQPVNVSAVAGETVLFRVEATGSDLTYAWYRSNDQGATWNKTYLNGYNTDTLTFDATAARAALYMCQITDGSGTVVWSNPVKLQILSAKLQIVSQPESVVCRNGDTATFRVEAQGDGLKYQWLASADGGETWTNTWLGGYNTDTLSFAVTASRAAKTYKCIITDASGNTVATNLVTIQVNK